jgi:DNA-binding transcriptional regulator YiaG
MKTRCLNTKHTYFYRYGGRGIAICDEWINSFESFMNWATKNGYSDEFELDRINNDGNYESSNCRFVTRKENMRNSSLCKIDDNAVFKIKEIYKTGNYRQQEIAEMFNTTQQTISRILKK